MNKVYLVMLAALLLSACKEQKSLVIDDTSTVLATVADYDVTQAYLDSYLVSKGVTEASDEQKAFALGEVVKLVALANESRKSGLEPSLGQLLRLKQIEHQILAKTAVDNQLLKYPVTEAELLAEYEKTTAAITSEEYHVRHLLFQDESQAVAVLDQLKSGLSYLDAESEYLKSNPQGRNVGDIGWVNVMQVPEVFREPLKSMQIETIYPQTLVSQFGVHVLYLADKRPLLAPGFDEVKAGIKKTLEQRKIERYEQLAVIKAKVKT